MLVDKMAPCGDPIESWHSSDRLAPTMTIWLLSDKYDSNHDLATSLKPYAVSFFTENIFA